MTYRSDGRGCFLSGRRRAVREARSVPAVPIFLPYRPSAVCIPSCHRWPRAAGGAKHRRACDRLEDGDESAFTVAIE